MSRLSVGGRPQGVLYLRQLAVALDLLGATAVAGLRYPAGRMGAGLDDLPVHQSARTADRAEWRAEEESQGKVPGLGTVGHLVLCSWACEVLVIGTGAVWGVIAGAVGAKSLLFQRVGGLGPSAVPF